MAVAKKTSLEQFARVRQPQASERDQGALLLNPGPRKRQRRGRGGLVAMTVRMTPEDWRRLRQLADAEGFSVQELGIMGFSAVFERYGLAPMET